VTGASGEAVGGNDGELVELEVELEVEVELEANVLAVAFFEVFVEGVVVDEGLAAPEVGPKDGEEGVGGEELPDVAGPAVEEEVELELEGKLLELEEVAADPSDEEETAGGLSLGTVFAVASSTASTAFCRQ